VKALLDTQAFLYSVAEPERLSVRAREVIEDLANELLFSVGSAWQIAIKVGIGKLIPGQPLTVLIPRQLEATRLSLLPITLEHVATVSTLPLHHRDPFDRLLVAQAMVEGIPLISNDTAFDEYGIDRLW
jgi:PIN domain nuclease of toxin-antitoxin system